MSAPNDDSLITINVEFNDFKYDIPVESPVAESSSSDIGKKIVNAHLQLEELINKHVKPDPRVPSGLKDEKRVCYKVEPDGIRTPLNIQSAVRNGDRIVSRPRAAKG